MRFYHVLKRKKFLFISMFLFLYFLTNFFDGNRGLFSYLEKSKVKKELINKKNKLNTDLKKIEHKNFLLSEKPNFDFIDTLVRDKLKFGHKNEILIKLDE